MNPNHVMAMTKSLATLPSRREVLLGLSGVGLGLGTSWLPEIVDAKKKRKRKRKHKKKEKPVEPNEFGCFEVGDPCRSEADCCSGICEGKTCRAHGTGTCEQGNDQHLCGSGNPYAVVCNGECLCIRTTAGSNYCGQLLAPTICADCKKDADCEALGLPPGSACAPFSAGFPCDQCEGGTVCLAPCGTPVPGHD